MPACLPAKLYLSDDGRAAQQAQALVDPSMPKQAQASIALL
jgi:hypothetical protein